MAEGMTLLSRGIEVAGRLSRGFGICLRACGRVRCGVDLRDSFPVSVGYRHRGATVRDGDCVGKPAGFAGISVTAVGAWTVRLRDA